MDAQIRFSLNLEASNEDDERRREDNNNKNSGNSSSSVHRQSVCAGVRSDLTEVRRDLSQLKSDLSETRQGLDKDKKPLMDMMNRLESISSSSSSPKKIKSPPGSSDVHAGQGGKTFRFSNFDEKKEDQASAVVNGGEGLGERRGSCKEMAEAQKAMAQLEKTISEMRKPELQIRVCVSTPTCFPSVGKQEV